MTCLERILASKSVQALLDICIGPELDSPRKDRTEQEATATASVDDRFQGYTPRECLRTESSIEKPSTGNLQALKASNKQR
jgi:hypothetical protein